MSDKFAKLKGLLMELFQLNEPDLDFGIYRILRARSAEVSQFLEKDLKPQAQEAFEQYQSADKAELEKELEELVKSLENARVDPSQSPTVQELKQRLKDQAVDISALEGDVYDHLFNFFRRYYSEGDFLSKRVYKEGVYAIPYQGEEVKLHWANADQYYIKTSEYLRDYAFRLDPEAKDPRRVHFRLVDAAEGEHGNVKEGKEKARVFILAADDFIAEEEGDSGPELVIRFEYRPALSSDWPKALRKEKKQPPRQDDLIALAVEQILAVKDKALQFWIEALGRDHVLSSGEAANYSRLQAHLQRYTKRNTFDYFIHKDLRSFLRRELDFYIKNEIMHLDDIANATVPRVEQYLSKIRVIREIAHKIIAFLAQLEDFQKKLWLKKKFVTETSWCIRVGCIPESFYKEIAANTDQHDEWVGQCGIDSLSGDLVTAGYSKPLKPGFLKAHPSLMIDTKHFSAEFTERVLEAIGYVDGLTDGVLFHSENAQALRLMQSREGGRIDAVFNDPPYNTGQGDFNYRDSYQHSSWLTMMEHVTHQCWKLISPSGFLWTTLDDNEAEWFILSSSQLLGRDSVLPRIAWQHSIQGKGYDGSVSLHHNSVICLARSGEAKLALLKREESHNTAYKNPDSDPKGPWRTGDVRNSLVRPNLRYEIVTPSGRVIVPPENGWRWKRATMETKIASGEVFFSEDESRIVRKIYLQDQAGRVPESIWFGKEVGTSRSANSELKRLFGLAPFGTPKPTKLVQRTMTLSGGSRFGDYFAGSGTTGHAVINLNREDGGQRKFILVEMGDYFDTVLLPRLKKVTFTPEWKGGKPVRLATAEEVERSPRIMKVIRLESYEDTLNNLELKARMSSQTELLDSRDAGGAGGFREDYILRYMLDVETRGSQSLLNIEAFSDPTAYKLKVKRPGSDESREVTVDLVETFNWLLGLTVNRVHAPRTYSANFKRRKDKDLPKDHLGRLVIDGALKEDTNGPWWFRAVSGTTPQGRSALVIWRRLTGDLDKDNAILNAWFSGQGFLGQESSPDVVYVNGSNNLEVLKKPAELWSARLIEDDFHRLMFGGDL